MKYLATIQSEFIKFARKWDDLSYEEQLGYLKRHPRTKRKLTAKPNGNQKVEKETEKSKKIRPKIEKQEPTEKQKLVEKQEPIKKEEPIGAEVIDQNLALTDVQQKIFDALQPLIKELQNRAVEYYDEMLKKFETAKNAAPQDKQASTFIYEFAKYDDTLVSIIRSAYKSETYPSRLNTLKYDEQGKKRYYEIIKQGIKEYNIQKLVGALHKYITPDFKEISNIHLNRGRTGFEISARLKDDQNRNWFFNTKAIGAGGYNIQVWHYRYLINLSSPDVPKEIVRQRVTEQERKEKEDKREQRNKERMERNKEKYAKSIATIFQEIKSRIKDWDTWEKHNLESRIAQGIRSQDEMVQIQEEINRYQAFLNKYPYKRKEITNKVINGEFSISDFNEIDDLLQSNDIRFYHYKRLKREG